MGVKTYPALPASDTASERLLPRSEDGFPLCESRWHQLSLRSAPSFPQGPVEERAQHGKSILDRASVESRRLKISDHSYLHNGNQGE